MGDAIGYVRVSTGKQADEGVSLANQRQKVEAYATMKGFRLVDIIEDSAKSGTVPLESRDGGQRLIEALENGSHVIALKLDRLFRDAADALIQTREWDKADVSLHLVDMGGSAIDTSSAMGRMFLTMLAGFAEFERNMIVERTVSALQYKKRNGEVYSALPLGYADEGGKLIPLDDELRVVAEIRSMHKDGLSLHKIAADLNGRGITGKRGGKFFASTVRAILGNDIHFGLERAMDAYKARFNEGATVATWTGTES